MEEKTDRLVYRTTKERGRALRQMALDEGIKVQGLLESAVDLLLNPPAESTEPSVKKLTPNRHELVHNYPIEHWLLWAEMVLVSDNKYAVYGLGANIQGFLYKLMAKKDQTGGFTDGSTTTPDYAAEAERAEEALDQLGRYFEAKRKRVRRVSRKPKT